MGLFGFLRKKDERAIPEPGTPEFDAAVQGSALSDSQSVSMGQEGWSSPDAKVETSSQTVDLRGTAARDLRSSRIAGCAGGHPGRPSTRRSARARVNRLRTRDAGSPLIPLPPLMSARIAMPACLAPGRLIDAVIQWQSVEHSVRWRPLGWHSVGWRCARRVERPTGGRTGWLLGRFKAGWRPGHFRFNGPSRSWRGLVDAGPRRCLKDQPRNVRRQLRHRDE